MIAQPHDDTDALQVAADDRNPIRHVDFAGLADADRALIRSALEISRNSYSPYSNFAVGAAVRGRSGKVHVGTNFENASYGLTMCAEVAALTAANTAGEHAIEAIAVIGHRYVAPESTAAPVTPCGRCRQLIAEVAQAGGIDVRVLSCSADLQVIMDCTIADLLPEAFGPASMGTVETWNRTRPRLEAAVARLRQRPR
jgi:cytidine deaminase